MKRCAFTLAETLITLAIIGVIAAMTIGNLVKNIEKAKIETGIRVSYSLLSNAVKMSVAQNGPVDDWEFPTVSWNIQMLKDFSKKYLIPYLKVVEHGDWVSGQYFAGTRNAWFGSSGDVVGNDSSNQTSYFIKLANGMSLAVNYANSAGQGQVKIIVDIDGPSKGGSVQGRDVFTYSIGLKSRYSGRKHGLIPGYTYQNWTSMAAIDYPYKGDPGFDSNWTLHTCCTTCWASGAQSTGLSGSNCIIPIVRNGYKIPKSYPLDKIPKRGYYKNPNQK